jgi:flagellar biosynthetic protein FliR
MSVEGLLQLVPTYVLVFFRVAGMMLFAPLFGSGRIPKRIKVMLAAVLTLALVQGVTPVAALPDNEWELAVGIAGELSFGLAMGMVLSFVFVAAQWAGQMIGQQMGLDMSEVFDPQFGSAGSVVGEFYYMLTLIVFLVAQGHHAMLRGVRDSFDAVPLLALAMNEGVLDLLFGLFQSSTMLALRLAGPTFVTMLVVDVVLGFVGKTMPQMNVMSAGLTIRSVMGMGVLLLGMGMSSEVIAQELLASMEAVTWAWRTGFAAGS